MLGLRVSGATVGQQNREKIDSVILAPSTAKPSLLRVLAPKLEALGLQSRTQRRPGQLKMVSNRPARGSKTAKVGSVGEALKNGLWTDRESRKIKAKRCVTGGPYD